MHPEQTAALVSSQYPHDSCLCVSFARSAQHGFSGAVLTPLWKPSLGDVQGVLLLLEASHSLTVPRTTFHLFCKPIWMLTKADGVREHGRFGATSLPRESQRSPGGRGGVQASPGWVALPSLDGIGFSLAGLCGPQGGLRVLPARGSHGRSACAQGRDAGTLPMGWSTRRRAPGCHSALLVFNPGCR